MADTENLQSVPDVWADSRERDPYLHNIFVILDCDPDESERTFDNSRQMLGREVKRGGKRVNGYEVQEIDVTSADELATNATRFVASRLLVHSAHKLDKSVFEEAIKAVQSHKPDDPKNYLPLAVRDLTQLHQLLPEAAEVLPGEETRLPKEQLPEIFLPAASEEQILDL